MKKFILLMCLVFSLSLVSSANTFTITDYTYGSGDDVTAKSYGVALENTHADSDASLVGHWQFTDDATDSSGNGNDGTVTGATHNYSWYDFDGNNYISVADDNSLDIFEGDNFTVSLWLNAKNLSVANEVLIGKGSQLMYFSIKEGAWFIRFDGDDTWVLGIANNTNYKQDAIKSPVISLNNWYHILVTYNSLSGNWSGFTNGVSNGASYQMFGSYNNSHNLKIGSEIIHIDRSFNGSIDEVAIYNRSLNSTEITALYNKGLFKHQGNYTSGILDAGQNVNWTNINWTFSNSTAKQNVSMQVRTGDTYYNVSAGENESGTWSNWTSELLVSQGETLDLPVNRFLQYKAKLQTNTSETPILSKVVATYDIESTIPSLAYFNLIFETLSRTDLVYFLEFTSTARANRTAKDYEWIGANNTVSTSTIGDYAIDFIERANCGMVCQATMWVFGMTNLPEHIDETNYYVMFLSNESSKVVSVPINITNIFDVSSISETLDNQSLRLYASTIFGGLEVYNSTQDDIPFYVE